MEEGWVGGGVGRRREEREGCVGGGRGRRKEGERGEGKKMEEGV